MNPTEDELVDFCYQYRIEYFEKTRSSQREFDCLICLIENGDITTWDQLSEYGMYKFGENKEDIG